MKTVSIRELHMHTGKWVRNVSEPVIITVRGRPVASLSPLSVTPRMSFQDRTLVRVFEQLPGILSDSGQFFGRE